MTKTNQTLFAVLNAMRYNLITKFALTSVFVVSVSLLLLLSTYIDMCIQGNRLWRESVKN